MDYTKKFQQLADAAIERGAAVMPEDLDAILAGGGVALERRCYKDHAAGDVMPTSLAYAPMFCIRTMRCIMHSR
jgi:hypothetical protein